jgi:hypothetical protein
MLGYGITAYVCYPKDHPTSLVSAGWLFTTLLLLDLIALAVCATGAFVSWTAWRNVRPGEGRNRFLALWGMMSSLWFFAAVLFNVFASVMVPACRS